MGIVMTVTIQLKAIMMAETAVHLMRILIMIVGIPIVQNVNVFSPLVRTNGQQANVARSVTRKNVRSPAHVRRTARILAIYAMRMRVRNVKIIWTDGFAGIATRKSARRGRFVKSNVRTLAIYATVKNLVRIKKVPSIVRRH